MPSVYHNTADEVLTLGALANSECVLCEKVDVFALAML